MSFFQSAIMDSTCNETIVSKIPKKQTNDRRTPDQERITLADPTLISTNPYLRPLIVAAAVTTAMCCHAIAI